jgi:hypothetical protein
MAGSDLPLHIASFSYCDVAILEVIIREHSW